MLPTALFGALVRGLELQPGDLSGNPANFGGIGHNTGTGQIC